MAMRHLFALGFILYSALSLSACDDEAPPSTFDVLIRSDYTEGNVPATFNFSAQNNGPLQGTYTYLWEFGDGSSSEEEAPSHTYTQRGEYEVTLKMTEAGGASGEGRATISILGSVNLTVNTLNFSPMSTLQPGDQVMASWFFKQTAKSVNGWRFGIYLIPDLGDPLQVEANQESLDLVGARFVSSAQGVNDEGALEQSVETAVPIPEGLSSGDYYLAIVADDEENVGEDDRQDNVALSAVPLRVRSATDSGPDLTVCTLSVSSFEGVEAGQRPVIPLGEQITVKLCLANAGDRPVIDTPFALYLSEDAILDEGDLLLNGGVEQALGPDDRIDLQVIVDLPLDASPSVYRLIGVADPEDQVQERDEENNQRLSPIPFELVEPGEVEGVDLVISSLSLDQDRVYWGQRLSGTLSLNNRGTQDISRSFVVRFNGISVDAGRAPQQLPSINIPSIAAGETLEVPFDLTITPRIPEGRYQLQVEVDPTNSTNDVNPGNNRRSSATLLNLGGTPSFDPVARALTLSQTEVNAGETMTVTLSLENLGENSTGSFEAALYLSADQFFGAGDPEIAVIEIENLEGQERLEVEFTPLIPLSLDQGVDRWYVVAQLDPQAALNGELSEENNLVFADEQLTVIGAMGGCGEDEFEDNDDVDRAYSLSAGSYPELGACDQADWFSINATADQVTIVTLSTASDSPSLPQLSLGDASGALLRGAERRGDVLILILPPADRATRSYLRITSGGEAVNYQLTIEQKDSEVGGDLELHSLSAQPNIAEAGAPVEVSVTLSNLGRGEISQGALTAELVTAPTLDADVVGTLTQAGGDLWTTPTIGAASSIQLDARLILPEMLVDGTYWLRVKHSGSDQYSYAWAITPLRIDQEQACTTDEFEPNGSPHEANALSTSAVDLTAGQYSDLYACSGDDDWYRIRLEEGDALDATITFNATAGDLDLALYAADGQTLLAESESLRGEERVTIYRSATATDYLLRVYLKNNGQANLATSYNLNLSVGPSQSCGDDGFEPNASAEEAALLPDGPHDLVVCPGGEDWFRFQVPAGNTVSFQVTVGFDDVEMTLLDPQGVVVDRNNRRIAHEALLNGAYLLKVTPSQQERPAPYTLVVSGVSGLDLTVDDLRLTSMIGGEGEELYADVTLESRRGDGADDILVRFTLSDDLRISNDDELLGEQRVPHLDGASSVELRQRITIPLGTAPGLYTVICEVDPLLELDDFSLSNNVTRATFEVTAACIDDDERENEGPRTATPIDWISSESREGVICSMTEDWYQIDVPSGQHTFTLNTPTGDLDLSVYRSSDLTLLGTSSTTEPVEEVQVQLTAETSLYLQVDGFFSERGNYTLSWE